MPRLIYSKCQKNLILQNWPARILKIFILRPGAGNATTALIFLPPVLTLSVQSHLAAATSAVASHRSCPSIASHRSCHTGRTSPLSVCQLHPADRTSCTAPRGSYSVNPTPPIAPRRSRSFARIRQSCPADRTPSTVSRRPQFVAPISSIAFPHPHLVDRYPPIVSRRPHLVA